MAFIVRIDKPKKAPARGGTHGWQVRGYGRRGYHSKLFSDNNHGGPEQARAAAEAYLQSYTESRPAEPRHRGKRLRSNKSGITGVYYTEYPHRWDKEHLVGYWCAFIPGGPEGQKFWFKRFNIERYGKREARRLAIEFRQEWEKAVVSGERALEEFWEEYYYSRLISTGFGSEEWDALSEGLLEIEASL